MNKSLEVNLLIGSLIWFALVATNVNPNLGFTYIGFASITLFLYIFDTKRTLEIERRKDNRIQAIIIGVVTWVGFTFVTAYIAGFLQKIDVGSLLRLLGASTPALAQSRILNFITFAFPVAFVETQLWARLMDYFGNRLKIGKTELMNFVAWAFILSLSFVFMIFHITSRGLSNNAGLLDVFLLMVTSYVLMFIFKETKQALFLHIFANLIASYFLFFM